jgi:hypothetical protein
VGRPAACKPPINSAARRYPGCGTAHWLALLEKVDSWVPAEANRVYAIVGLGTYRATGMLLFVLAHPRWEMVFQPKYAAYLNLVRGTAL